MKEKEHSLIHVRVEYEEGVQAKKELLSCEMEFLRILKILKKYHLLRKEELTNKLKLQNKMKDLKTNLGKLTEILPKVKVPENLRKKAVVEEGAVKEESKGKKAKEEKKEDDLETQLREIQDRLRNLG
jgi:hypothetical protein